MTMRKSMLAGAACCASIGAGLGAAVARADDAPAPQPLTALHCGHLIDTAAGTVLGATTIVIEGKRIRSVAGGNSPVPGATDIDLHDQTCLPGLIDSHTHLTGQTSPT